MTTPRINILLGLDNAGLLIAMGRRASSSRDLIVTWPEIDTGGDALHPSLHGALADHALLIGDSATVITHSDVFVLRIRRRIAEGKLAPADVALVWVEPDGSEKPIPLNDRGTPAWWPKGVHAESQAEFHEIRRALSMRDSAAIVCDGHADEHEQRARRWSIIALGCAIDHEPLPGVHIAAYEDREMLDRAAYHAAEARTMRDEADRLRAITNRVHAS